MLVNQCDEWQGTVNSSGYGSIYIAKTPDNRAGTWNAHRIVWMQDNGPIPTGYVVMHTCDNPRCVNPAHLQLGTQSDNMRDKSAKGRIHNARQRMCKHGHEWSKENIYLHPNGQWHCKQCRRNSDARRRSRRVAA